ncbi:MAG: hypothetical protein WCH34_02965 [Bacteroidota bacterium]
MDENISSIVFNNQSFSFRKIGSNIILITGNKDAKFEEYLRHISETVDVKDKVIVSFSYLNEVNDFTNSSIIMKVKKNSVIYFPTNIHSDATQKVLLRFSEVFSNNTNDKTVRELMEQSIVEAYSTETNEFLKSEIKKIEQFIRHTSLDKNI